jgi:hypothetical protein
MPICEVTTAGKRLTLRILLSHTSGFPNWRAFEKDRKLRIHFDPGTRYAILRRRHRACPTNSSNSEGIFKPLIDSLLGPTAFPFGWENYTPCNLLPPLPKLKEHKQVALTRDQLDRWKRPQ